MAKNIMLHQDYGSHKSGDRMTVADWKLKQMIDDKINFVILGKMQGIIGNREYVFEKKGTDEEE